MINSLPSLLHMQHQSNTATLCLKLSVVNILPKAAVQRKKLTFVGTLPNGFPRERELGSRLPNNFLFRPICIAYFIFLEAKQHILPCKRWWESIKEGCLWHGFLNLVPCSSASQVGDQYRSNDDGEPSGTAGKPIHSAILSSGIDRVMVVVIR